MRWRITSAFRSTNAVNWSQRATWTGLSPTSTRKAAIRLGTPSRACWKEATKSSWPVALNPRWLLSAASTYVRVSLMSLVTSLVWSTHPSLARNSGPARSRSRGWRAAAPGSWRSLAPSGVRAGGRPGAKLIGTFLDKHDYLRDTSVPLRAKLPPTRRTPTRRMSPAMASRPRLTILQEFALALLPRWWSC